MYTKLRRILGRKGAINLFSCVLAGVCLQRTIVMVMMILPSFAIIYTRLADPHLLLLNCAGLKVEGFLALLKHVFRVLRDRLAILQNAKGSKTRHGEEGKAQQGKINNLHQW